MRPVQILSSTFPNFSTLIAASACDLALQNQLLGALLIIALAIP